MLGFMQPSAAPTFADDFTSLSLRNALPSGANKIRNSEAFNAVLMSNSTGFGSDRAAVPGLPENWAFWPGSGLTFDLTAIGTATIDGQSRRTLTFRLHGTGGNDSYLLFEQDAVLRIAPGQSVTSSCYLALASGGTGITNVTTVSVSPDAWTDAGAYTNGGWNDTVFSLTNTLTRFAASFTVAAGAAWGKHSVTIKTTASAAVDMYFTVAAPMYELAAAASTYVPTTSDSGVWNTSYQWGPTNTINNEQAYYADTAADGTRLSLGINPFAVANSVLTITGSKPASGTLPNSYDGKTRKYVSGVLSTYRGFKQRFGYFEARLKWSGGQGVWPAFWMIPNTVDAIANGRQEIDIMEWPGLNIDTADTQAFFAIHSGTTAVPYDDGLQGSLPAGDMHANFHLYGVDWRADKITFYLDRKQVGTPRPTPADMQMPMYLMLNLALGGDWPGAVVEAGQIPATHQADYVRVWDRLPF